MWREDRPAAQAHSGSHAQIKLHSSNRLVPAQGTQLIAQGEQMNKVKAFLSGMREFRLSMTRRYENPALTKAYDQGREIAHKLTLRRFED